MKEQGIVLAQYQDESGKPLIGDEVMTGEVGSEYTTTQKVIEKSLELLLENMY